MKKKIFNSKIENEKFFFLQFKELLFPRLIMFTTLCYDGVEYFLCDFSCLSHHTLNVYSEVRNRSRYESVAVFYMNNIFEFHERVKSLLLVELSNRLTFKQTNCSELSR